MATRQIGIARKIDDMGRLTLPHEIREHLGLESGVMVECLMDEDRLIVRKPPSSCTFCNVGFAPSLMVTFHGRLICRNCIDDIKEGKYVAGIAF